MRSRTFSEGLLLLRCFSVQIKQNVQKRELCSATTGTPPLESTHQELSFEWSHLWVSLHCSGFIHFRGLVKSAISSESVNPCLQLHFTNISCSPTDVITIDRTGENFRMLYDVKGRFAVHRITAEEAKVRPSNKARQKS